jgi:hypothetical protein
MLLPCTNALSTERLTIGFASAAILPEVAHQYFAITTLHVVFHIRPWTFKFIAAIHMSRENPVWSALANSISGVNNTITFIW